MSKAITTKQLFDALTEGNHIFTHNGEVVNITPGVQGDCIITTSSLALVLEVALMELSYSEGKLRLRYPGKRDYFFAIFKQQTEL